MRKVKTVCEICGSGKCGINVYIEEGKITKIEGMEDHPATHGVLCAKAYGIKQYVYSPDRLKYPLMRSGEKGEGKWVRTSWDDALNTIAQKLKQIKKVDGPEAVAVKSGHLTLGGSFRQFMYRLVNVFGTPNVTDIGHICVVPRLVAAALTFGGFPNPDYKNTECILLWADNPAHSHIHWARGIFAAIDRGAKLVVIDSRFPPFAKLADVYVRIRPGTDGALALGMLNVILHEGLYDKEFVEKWTIGFDELNELVTAYPPEEVERITWVKADVVREISRMYATASSACIRIGNGFDQHTNSIQSLRAVLALMTVTGNLDIPGGNVFPLPSHPSFGFYDTPITLFDELGVKNTEKALGIEKYPFMRKRKPEYVPGQFLYAHEPSMFDAILTGEPYPIKALIVWASNPAVICANSNAVRQALKKLELLVVVDQFMTPTAELADIVLPASTFLEWNYYKAYPEHGFIMLRSQAIDPIGESWPDLKITLELAKRLGYEEYFPWKTIEEAMDAELNGTGVTYNQLLESEGLIYFPEESSNVHRKYEEQGFQTPSKKVELYSEQLNKHGYDPLPVYKEPAESPFSRSDLAKDYPLILITGEKLPTYTHSQFRNIPLLRDTMPENRLEIHPNTAMELDIRDGELVRIESLRGSVEIKAMLTEGIDPRVVHMHHGFAKQNANILTDNTMREPIIGSVGLKSSLCRVIKL